MSPLPADEAYQFCSVYSLEAAAEPLRATATRADIWLSLEYTGRWGARALPESVLPEAVKAHIGAFEIATANVRTQFIRRPGSYQPNPIHFFVSIATGTRPRLYRFELESYEALLDLDFEAMVSGQPDYEASLSRQQLFLVCNNGLRDACCAKFGIPVYHAVAEAGGADAWQCTHIGGHRLAPNLLFLPHAISYGRATPEIAATLVESYRDGEIYLPYLRGRTIYSRPEQAAEHFLREEQDLMGVDAVRALPAEELGGGQWSVRLVYGDGHDNAELVVEARPWPVPVYNKCTAEERIKVSHFYRV